MIGIQPCVDRMRPELPGRTWLDAVEHEEGRQETVAVSSSCRVFQMPPVVYLIGGTPLVRLIRVTEGLSPAITLYAKLEGANPGGSVKDRPALFIIQEALRTGMLGSGKRLIDATSGNTGIAFAMLGAALGFAVELTLPADVSPERVQILRAYGARLTLTDPAAKTDGARNAACEMVAAEPERYFYADQYNNPANPLAHYATTGPELWQQTGGGVTHFVAGMGTSGTMMGTGRYLKEQSAAVQLIGVQPVSPQKNIPGLKHLATSDSLRIYDPGLVDEIAEVDVEDARVLARRMAQEEGLFVGVSAGAAVVAALRVARELDRGGAPRGVVVALLPDGGFKYASAPFWGDA